MLKRLEMVGFKSFADKTRFDFDAGITGIVGPNGSGKSNVVDAVRWVLGEQSAKSLRGDEMADVIFNGSTSRRGLAMAEVTITFDNSLKRLATEAAEVQITRRVYRGGESEYLINQQPSRLKDIKDLFLGSGAGTDAYCIIEQGRVDILLQASTQERRSIFEEAAGISRFKARKLETLRRLERVDQNLQRLLDIIGEVEKQFRSVKLQAAKAQRFQEHSNRLRELRVALALVEHHSLTNQLRVETAVLQRMRADLDERAQQSRAWEEQLAELERRMTTLDGNVHDAESRLAAAREQITAEKTTLDHEGALTEKLTGDRRRTFVQLSEMNAHTTSLQEAVARLDAEMTGIEAQAREQGKQTIVLEHELTEAAERLRQLHDQVNNDKNAHLEEMRRAARLQNDTISFKAHLDNLKREHDRLCQRTAQAAEHLASVDLELQQRKEADDTLQAQMTGARKGLTDQRQERELLRQLRDRTTATVTELSAQWSGLTSRIQVLEGLERSSEGLGAGVREIRDRIRQAAPGPWDTVLGMVADLIGVRREHAHLIDLAIGEAAQHFVVRDPQTLDDAMRRQGQAFTGRVSFLPLRGSSARATDGESQVRLPVPMAPDGTPVHPGVIAFAANLVSCEHPELKDFPAQLLGRTLLVRDLALAHDLAFYAAGYRFVTLQGELLEVDGTVTVGTYHAEAGLLSRKSELRDLRQQSATLEQRVRAAEQELAGQRERIALYDRRLEDRQKEIDVLAEQIGDLRSRIGQHKERRDDLRQEVEVSRSEINGLTEDIQRIEASWTSAREQAELTERQVQTIKARIDQAEHEARRHEEEHEQRQQQFTAAKVALAQVEERVKALRARRRQAEADLTHRLQERAQVEQQLQAARTRLDDSQRAMLRASAALAHLYLVKEESERQLLEHHAARERIRLERTALQEKAQEVHTAWHAEQQQLHARELAVNDLQHRRDAQVERIREDYQVDLASVYQQGMTAGTWPECTPPVVEGGGDTVHDAPPAGARETASGPPAIDSAAANLEMEELRRKLNRLGSVNLDSIQQLAELEQRAKTLQTQHDDLTQAKKSLEEIIAKINEDSRRLFVETLQTVRGHFQELFRKLFGGGMADIVLENEADVLESGIEIIARPPGKELRSISLMSGGEKTLTAVGLLLAIFRSKPSPFCLLDEVDAALDEANIGRFTSVLREFLDVSQFIIITHSKRTMAAADVLYGVTMQESGISRRVAVRFEDWPDDDRAAEPAAASNSA